MNERMIRDLRNELAAVRPPAPAGSRPDPAGAAGPKVELGEHVATLRSGGDLVDMRMVVDEDGPALLVTVWDDGLEISASVKLDGFQVERLAERAGYALGRMKEALES